ncbi:MAG TPA: glycosyltransferase, partial [Afifellaceae bacterium]|nr:glycosyltransferase [Afifellaceae bacterium]
MRVLHLVSGLMLGGGQQVALSLAEGLGRRAGIAAEVGLLGCTEERLRDATAFVIDYDGNYASPVSLALAAAQLRAALRRRHFDLVHSHGWDADIVARWALADRPEPQLVHLHVTPGWIHSGALKHRVRRAMTRRLFAAPSVGMAAVADAVRAHWAGVFPKTAGKMRVLHNGVDVDRFRPLAEPQSRRADMQPVIIGTACRLAPQ